jgi:hypothetical protein
VNAPNEGETYDEKIFLKLKDGHTATLFVSAEDGEMYLWVDE